jgi:hypothetical protein
VVLVVLSPTERVRTTVLSHNILEKQKPLKNTILNNKMRLSIATIVFATIFSIANATGLRGDSDESLDSVVDKWLDNQTLPQNMSNIIDGIFETDWDNTLDFDEEPENDDEGTYTPSDAVTMFSDPPTPNNNVADGSDEPTGTPIEADIESDEPTITPSDNDTSGTSPPTVVDNVPFIPSDPPSSDATISPTDSNLFDLSIDPRYDSTTQPTEDHSDWDKYPIVPLSDDINCSFITYGKDTSFEVCYTAELELVNEVAFENQGESPELQHFVYKYNVNGKNDSPVRIELSVEFLYENYFEKDVNRCDVSIDEEFCQSCSYCGDDEYSVDCSNIPKGRITECEPSLPIFFPLVEDSLT